MKEIKDILAGVLEAFVIVKDDKGRIIEKILDEEEIDILARAQSQALEKILK